MLNTSCGGRYRVLSALTFRWSVRVHLARHADNGGTRGRQRADSCHLLGSPDRIGLRMNQHLQYRRNADHRHNLVHPAADAPEHAGKPLLKPASQTWMHRAMKPRDFLAMVGGSAVVLFGLTWLWIVTMPMAFLDPEYPSWRAKQMLLGSCDLGDILVLGDSRAATAMMPAGWRVRATNLAVGGGEPIEALAALDRALQCKIPPRQVILSFDAVHFAEPDLFWERSARFGFVNADEIATLRKVSYRLGDVSIYELRHTDGLPSWLRDAMYQVRFPSLYFTSLAKGGVLLRWPRNRANLAATLAARGQYFFRALPPVPISSRRTAIWRRFSLCPYWNGTSIVFCNN